MANRGSTVGNPAARTVPVSSNGGGADPEVELTRSEAEAAALEASLTHELARLHATAREVDERLQALMAAAVEGPSEDPDISELYQRLKRAALPGLDVEPHQARARAARAEALQTRIDAGEAARAAMQAFAASLTKINGQLGVDEKVLQERREKARAAAEASEAEEARRREAAKALPPPLRARAADPSTKALAPPENDEEVALEAELEAEIEPEPVLLKQVRAPKPAAPPTPRRDNPRVQMQATVDLQSDTNFFNGFSTNISDGGLFIATVQALPIGTPVDLNFTLPSGEKLGVSGVVRWVREVNDNTPEIFPGLGVQFVNLSAPTQEKIRQFVASREPMFYPD